MHPMQAVQSLCPQSIQHTVLTCSVRRVLAGVEERLLVADRVGGVLAGNDGRHEAAAAAGLCACQMVHSALVLPCLLAFSATHLACRDAHRLLTLTSISRPVQCITRVYMKHTLSPESTIAGTSRLGCYCTSHRTVCLHRAMPWLPCTSIFFNVFLMGNLPYKSFIRFGVLIATGLIIYFLYGLHGSYDRFLCAPLLCLPLVVPRAARPQLYCCSVKGRKLLNKTDWGKVLAQQLQHLPPPYCGSLNAQ